MGEDRHDRPPLASLGLQWPFSSFHWQERWVVSWGLDSCPAGAAGPLQATASPGQGQAGRAEGTLDPALRAPSCAVARSSDRRRGCRAPRSWQGGRPPAGQAGTGRPAPRPAWGHHSASSGPRPPTRCLSDQLRVPCLSHQWQRGRGGHHLELESSRTPVLHRGSAGAPPTWKAPSLVPREPGASRSGPWMGSACLPKSGSSVPCSLRGKWCFPVCFQVPFPGFSGRAVVRPCGWLSAHPPAGVCRARQPWRPGSPIGSGNASLSSSTFFCSVSRFLLLHPVPRPTRHPAVCRT